MFGENGAFAVWRHLNPIFAHEKSLTRATSFSLQGSATLRRDLLAGARAVHRGRRGQGGPHGRGGAALRLPRLHAGPVRGGAGGVRGAQRVADQPGAQPHHLRVSGAAAQCALPLPLLMDWCWSSASSPPGGPWSAAQWRLLACHHFRSFPALASVTLFLNYFSAQSL